MYEGIRNFVKRMLNKKAIEEAGRPFGELDSLKNYVCPNCAGESWLCGPCGGMAQNIECYKCGACFNVAPFDGGWCGIPIIMERIGWNRSGRWAEIGVLKEKI